MSDQKLKLSDELLSRAASGASTATTATNQTEVLKNERASIESNAKVDVARLQVAKEAIAATKSLFEVIKSNNQLKTTISEWQGRVTQAEIEVRKAEISLQETRENNQARVEEKAQLRDSLGRVLELFDFTMEELKQLDCSKDEKAKIRRELLEVSDRLVQLNK